MSAVSRLASRRRILRGVLGGTAVSMGLPFLDCFLDNSGRAEAATGKALPVCFGTWFNGLGLIPGFWEPKKAGADYDLPVLLEPLRRFKNKMNIYSGMRVLLDGHAPKVHDTGAIAMIGGGIPPGDGQNYGIAYPSIDVLVADHIGTRTRFRSLEVNCVGERTSYSRRSGSAVNPAEPSPVALYQTIFGPEFKDPNAATFSPDPAVMARKSVLSAFSEERQKLVADLGTADKARIDEYFTALRQLEGQLALQLEKPAPLESCTIPGKADNGPISHVMEEAAATHKLFSGLLTHALACGQTRIINVVLDAAIGNLRRAASPVTFHIHTHEEPVDPKIGNGWQPNVSWFMLQSLAALNDLLTSLESIKEGDRTLLDRMVIVTCTDTGFAKFHSLENIPMLTFGGAGGAIKTGIHVPCNGDTTSRVGLTLQQGLGLPIDAWGTESNRTSKTITEVLA